MCTPVQALPEAPLCAGAVRGSQYCPQALIGNFAKLGHRVLPLELGDQIGLVVPSEFKVREASPPII